MGEVGVQGGDINGDKQDIGGKGDGEGAEDGKEMVRIFDVRSKGLDDGLEVEVNKNRNPLSDRVMDSNNGAASVYWVCGFYGVERGWGCGDWGYQGERCLGKRDHGGDQQFEGK
jgi:hypothetical protein